MKRAVLLALTALLLLPYIIGGIYGELGARDAVFEKEDNLRKDALSAAMGRTEGSSLRFFSQKNIKTEGRYIVRFDAAMPQRIHASFGVARARVCGLSGGRAGV